MIAALLIPGDAAATAARITAHLDAGEIATAERLRLVWTLRELRDVETFDGRALLRPLLERLDPGGRIPPRPDIRRLRTWIETLTRTEPRGALGRLAREAGLGRGDLSRFRCGSALTPAKVELLGAALIAAGMVEGETRTHRNHAPRSRTRFFRNSGSGRPGGRIRKDRR